MPQLDVSTYVSQLFWLFTCFAATLVFTAYVTVPRMKKTFQMRWERIEGTMQKAEEINQQADNLREEFEKILADVRKDANQLVVSTINSVNILASKRKHDIADIMTSRIKSSESRIERQKNKAVEDLKLIAGDLTNTIVEKLIDKQVDPDDVRAKLDEIIKEKVV
jgi:F-type H+-transporting ATPase subunit b